MRRCRRGRLDNPRVLAAPGRPSDLQYGQLFWFGDVRAATADGDPELLVRFEGNGWQAVLFQATGSVFFDADDNSVSASKVLYRTSGTTGDTLRIDVEGKPLVTDVD